MTELRTVRIDPIRCSATLTVAGAAGLRYRSFLAASVLGAVAWSAVWVGVAASGVLDQPWLLAVAAMLATVPLLGRHVRRVVPKHAPPLNRVPVAASTSTVAIGV